MEVSQYMLMVMGRGEGSFVICPDFFAPNVHGDFRLGFARLSKCQLQRFSFVRAGGIVFYWFVFLFRYFEKTFKHNFFIYLNNDNGLFWETIANNEKDDNRISKKLPKFLQ